jgi:cation:H+ antiporter
MTPAFAAPLFVASIALMLVAAAQFARRLDHAGLRLGLPEALLGVLTAFAADAPEVSSAISALVQHDHEVAVGVVVGSNAFNLAAMLGLSAIVAGRVRAGHDTFQLEAWAGLLLLAPLLAVVAGVVPAAVGGAVAAAVFVPYVVLLSRTPREEAKAPHSRREAAQVLGILLLALGVIVAGSVVAVRSASDLAHAWSVPQALVGVLVLAILTSLPNAWTGVRFGLQGRGSALTSETLNSNSINLVAGLALPAALGSLTTFSDLDVFDLAWLIAMTTAALVLFGRRGGAGRPAGALLIVLYAAFLIVQVAARA